MRYDLLVTAIVFASKAESGALDKQGKPVIFHCLRVMFALHADGHGLEILCAGVLHDYLEDGGDLQELKAAMPDLVVSLVLALTRREGEKYSDYIARIKASDERASVIKLKDLADNLDESRGEIPASLRKRYQRAYRELQPSCLLPARALSDAEAEFGRIIFPQILPLHHPARIRHHLRLHT